MESMIRRGLESGSIAGNAPVATFKSDGMLATKVPVVLVSGVCAERSDSDGSDVGSLNCCL